MKTTTVFSIGQSVEWTGKKEVCTGKVHDDFGLGKVMVDVITINGVKTVGTKIRQVQRELLTIVKKDKMATDIKKVLLQGKYKKYAKQQLIDKVSKLPEGDEKQVVIELLRNRGVSDEEMGLTTSVETVLEPETETPEYGEGEFGQPVELENEEELEPQPEVEAKMTHKKAGNSHVVEFEEEDSEVIVEEKPKTGKVKKELFKIPAEGTKSRQIYDYLENHRTEKIPEIAKMFNTYYPFVLKMKKILEHVENSKAV